MNPGGSESGSVARPPATWRIVLISGVVNLALLLVFEATQQGIWPSANSLSLATWPLLQSEPETKVAPEGAISAKVDLPALPPQKESLKLTVARQVIPPSETLTAAETSPAAPETVPEQSLSLSSSEESQAMAPVLLKDPKSGAIRIGQFKSLTMEGDSEQCLDIAHSMLEDIGANGDLLDVMAASDSITIAKICTANGSVVFTCRNNSVVVSPRKSRPNESCEPT